MRPSIRRLCSFILGATAVITATSHAGAAEGDTFRLTAGGDLDWTPSSGSLNHTEAQAHSAQGVLTSPFGAALYALASGPGSGQIQLSGSFDNPGLETRGFNPTTAVLSTTRLTVIGPPGFVNIRTRAHVDVSVIVSCPAGFSCASTVTVFAGDHNTVVAFATTPIVDVNLLGLSVDAIPGGYRVYGDYLSPLRPVVANQPFDATLDLRLNLAILGIGAQTATFDLEGAVTFPSAGEVLEVPAGYTVTGSNVVANQWTDPFHVIISPPVANLAVSPPTGICNQPVSFDGSGSTAGAGALLVQYRWSFDDGSGTVVTPSPSIQHAYARLGVFHPSLVVVDDNGNQSDPSQRTVLVLDQGAPTAAFTGPASFLQGQAVNFDGSASSDPEGDCGSRIVNWTWRLDSGPPVTLSSPNLTSALFASELTPGSHTLSLVVTDDSGNVSAPSTRQVTVRSLPVAQLLVLPSTAKCGEPVSFDGSGSTAGAGASLVQYRWSFDDGSGSLVTPGSSIQHAYARLGVFHPSLVVVDDNGNQSDPSQRTVLVLDQGAPAAAFTGPASFLQGQAVNFDGSASSDQESACGSRIVNWTWRLDNWAPVSLASPVVSTALFAGQLTPGTHSLTLVVTDDSGNVSAPVIQKFTVGATGGTVRLFLDAVPDGATAFTLTGPAPVGSVTLDDLPASATPREVTVENVPPGAYAVVMDPAPGFALIQLPCTDPDGGTTSSVPNGSATLDVDIGEIISCTFVVVNMSNATITANALHSLGYSLNEGTSILVQTQFSAAEIALGLKNSSYQASATATAVALAVANFSAATTASALQAAFQLSATASAGTLFAAGYAATATADALRLTYSLSTTAAATAMAAAGYTSGQIALALRDSGYQASATTTAIALAAANFSAAATAAALQTAFQLSVNGSAAALFAANYTAAATVEALRLTYGAAVSVTVAVNALFSAGFPAAAVAEAARLSYGLTVNAAAIAMAAAGYTSGQIALALRDSGYQASATTTAIALAAANFSAAATAAALQTAFQLSVNGSAAALFAANYTAAATVEALRLTYGAAVTVTVAVNALFSAGFPAAAVAEAARLSYGLTVNAAAIAMAAAGYTAGQIALALRDSGYQASATTTAIALAAANFSAATVATALDLSYTIGATAVAAVLAAAGYSANSAATALLVAYSATVTVTVVALVGAGYAAEQVAFAAVTVYSASSQAIAAALAAAGTDPSTIAEALQQSGFGSAQVAQALKSGVGLANSAVAVAMREAGYSIATIGARLEDTLGASASGAANILHDQLGATSTQIANMLKGDFGKSAGQTAAILTDLGYSATTIAKRLDDVFSKSATAAAGILKDNGFSGKKIAEALKEAYNKSASATVGVLNDLGYSLNTQVRVLDEVFNKGVDQITSILVNLGFSPQQVAAAIASVLGG